MQLLVPGIVVDLCIHADLICLHCILCCSLRQWYENGFGPWTQVQFGRRPIWSHARTQHVNTVDVYSMKIIVYQLSRGIS